MPDVVNGGEQGDRQLFAEDTRIIFNSDGSFVWRPANGDKHLQREEASQRPRYLIGEKGAKLYRARHGVRHLHRLLTHAISRSKATSSMPRIRAKR